MKLYALAFLLTICIFESEAARDWRPDTRYNYMKQINDIVNPALAGIRTDISIKGTEAAKACYEPARLSFASATSTGNSEISSCLRPPTITQGEANVCCQQAVSRVFQKRLDIARQASACINKA